jgi:hypothetical protein
VKPHQDVLKSIVQGMAHVKRSGDIRRRYDYGIFLAGLSFTGFEKLFFDPKIVPFFLNLRRIVNLG